MALTTVVNGVDAFIGRNNDYLSSSLESSSPQICGRSEFGKSGNLVRLPSMDKREALGHDAKDSNQQQQTLSVNSTSSSSCSLDLASEEFSVSSIQHLRNVTRSFEVSPSASPPRPRGNQSIKAARQRFLLEKNAKLQEAKTPPKAANIECQTSETSLQSSKPLHDALDAWNSFGIMSSNPPNSAQQKLGPPPLVRLPPQPLRGRNLRYSTITTNGGYKPSSSHGRLGNAFQNPRPQLPKGPSYFSSAPITYKHRAQNDWAIGEYLFVKVYDLPGNVTTRDLWGAFKNEGHIAHIRLHENAKGYRDGGASIKFSPPPAKAFWERRRYSIQLAGGSEILVRVHAETRQQLIFNCYSKTRYPETMTMYAESLEFGTMLNRTTMMNMCTVLPTGKLGIKFVLNVFHKEISVEFLMHIVDPQAVSNDPNTQRGKYDRTDLFQFRIPFTQLKVVHQIPGPGDKVVLLLCMETPPKFFKQLDPSKCHDDKAVTWGDNDAWYRQTDLEYVPNGLKKSSLTWRKTNPIIDLGRWTTYRLTFSSSNGIEPQFDQMRVALRDYNIEIIPFPSLHIIPRNDAPIWKLIDLPLTKQDNTGASLEEMMHPQMPFEVRYQLEVCLSQGFLNEHTLSKEFISKLLTMEIKQSQDLLEYIANHGRLLYDPMSAIQAMNGHRSLSRIKIPSYCAYIRSATVTPTTIYFHTPVAETSNRVIREYSQYTDRFLRVRFTEEKTEGKIYPTHKDTMNEVFTRVKRVLTNGIRIGNRTYEFLACGNSQFREHGAYFFAPPDNLTTEKIRKWMGMFKQIKTVALYASRLGQCFSTTRAIHGARAEIIQIPDIRRNGYNFTDGVGRISPFLAHLAASELGILQLSRDPPSVFQIRVGGCKGVLAVSPESAGRQIHIRKSQYKFPAVHEGLEIIRWSQYASANLNRQLILILSALGVPDHVFAQKLQTQLSRLERAMTDETTALAILQKEIDHNQMTLTVASMILDGFQRTGEPFLTSLLQLWRAWSIKYLKEKARITIGAGALLLGCVDETATLRGHSNNAPRLSTDTSNDEKAKHVPQIFVQTSKNSDGKFEVILGPMLLARNPSLHPGDIRVVCGVDVPQLHHLKDVVVLPQTGDRDVAGMCSGGDLDGDDFLVIWDQDLLPSEWNHEPMDYSRPPMEQPNENIGLDDLTSFFVTYMKNDALPAIAQAHTANADYLEEGVRAAKCLKLANLHSMAVDYVKTGQPARLSRDLKPLKWPHFMEKVGKQQHQIYTSRKVLGQLYDQVERIDFVPAFAAPFDTRILQAYTLEENILQSAREIKEEYDAHMRRIMAQQEIHTEFEVWSTFVLQHSSTSNAFKYHEQIGEISMNLKEQFRLVCFERAGGKDYEHIGPFAAAMYVVTAREVTAAVEECCCFQVVGGQHKPLREMTSSTMPLMSFPWLFQDVLGKIAKRITPETVDGLSVGRQIGLEGSAQLEVVMAPQPKRGRIGLGTLDSSDYLRTSKGTTRPGELLELFEMSGESCKRKAPAEGEYIPSSSISVSPSNSSMGTSVERGSSTNDQLTGNSSSSSPKILTRKPYERHSHNVEMHAKENRNSTGSSVNHFDGYGGPLCSWEKAEAGRTGVKDKVTALDKSSCERVCADGRPLSVEHDYKMPEENNLRLLNDLAMGLSARSDEARDLTSKSLRVEEKGCLEDVSLAEVKAAKTNGLSKNYVSDDGDKNGDTETIYSSNSGVESDDVLLYDDNQARLLDQLAEMVGANSALGMRESEDEEGSDAFPSMLDALTQAVNTNHDLE